MTSGWHYVDEIEIFFQKGFGHGVTVNPRNRQTFPNCLHDLIGNHVFSFFEKRRHESQHRQTGDVRLEVELR